MIGRVLLVAYAFPPVVNAQAIRWLMLVRELARRGTHVEVLTVRLPEYFHDLVDEIPQHVIVHRSWPGPIEGSARSARAGTRADDDWIAARRRRGGHGVARAMYRAARRLANACLVPDLHTEWLPVGYAAGRRVCRKSRFDAIVSSSEPGVSHLVAWRLSRHTGLPWLADFGDPWINQNTPPWRRALDAAVERRMLGAIDVATVTTEELARRYEHRYQHLRPVRVVRQGFDRELLGNVTAERTLPDTTLSIVYTGTLYPRMRDPHAVFEALRLTRESGLPAVLTIAGRVPESLMDVATRLGVADAVRFAGVVPYKRALALQQGADVLLHLDNADTPLQTPGKLYEYVGTARPVLVVRRGHAAESAAARLVDEGGFGRHVPDDPRAIAEALAAFDADRRTGRGRRSTDEFVERFTYARAADELCRGLEDAIGRRRNDR